jgi:hypothetical protein
VDGRVEPGHDELASNFVPPNARELLRAGALG